MPGIDMSLVEQQEYYESLLKKYKNDKELLVSYKDICTFDISRLEKGPSGEFLSRSNKMNEQHKDENLIIKSIDTSIQETPQQSTDLTQSMEVINLKTNL
jgi:hypothetical protein